MPITHVGGGEISNEANDTTITLSYNPAGGSSNLLVVGVAGRNAAGPDSVEWDGVGVTNVLAWTTFGSFALGIWKELDPVTGSKDLIVVFPANTRPKVIIIAEYAGADDVDTTNEVTASGTSTAPAGSITTNAANSMVVAMIQHDANSNPAPAFDWTGGSESGETERIDAGSGAGPNSLLFSLADIIKATAGAQDMSATSDSGGIWRIGIVEVIEEAVAAAKPITATLTVPRYPNEHRQHQVFA